MPAPFRHIAMAMIARVARGSGVALEQTFLSRRLKVDTANVTALEVNGGTVNVTATNMFNNGTVRGHGMFQSVFFRNVLIAFRVIEYEISQFLIIEPTRPKVVTLPPNDFQCHLATKLIVSLLQLKRVLV